MRSPLEHALRLPLPSERRPQSEGPAGHGGEGPRGLPHAPRAAGAGRSAALASAPAIEAAFWGQCVFFCIFFPEFKPTLILFLALKKNLFLFWVLSPACVCVSCVPGARVPRRESVVGRGAFAAGLHFLPTGAWCGAWCLPPDAPPSVLWVPGARRCRVACPVPGGRRGCRAGLRAEPLPRRPGLPAGGAPLPQVPCRLPALAAPAPPRAPSPALGVRLSVGAPFRLRDSPLPCALAGWGSRRPCHRHLGPVVSASRYS